MRNQAEAEQKQNLQRALDGLIPGLQDIEMVDGCQHDICDWLYSSNYNLVAYVTQMMGIGSPP